MGWKVERATTKRLVFGNENQPDCIVTIYKLPADKALHFGGFMIALIGKPLLAMLADMLANKNDGVGIDIASTLAACLDEADAALMRLGPEALDRLAYEYIFPAVSIEIDGKRYENLHGADGRKKIIELFEGHNAEFLQVLFEGAKWNASDFLDVKWLKGLMKPN